VRGAGRARHLLHVALPPLGRGSRARVPFSRDLLDEKATLAAIEQAASSIRLDAARALREAEREATRADERLARVRRAFTDGALTVEEWRGFADDIEGERRGALAEVERLRRHVADLAREAPLHDAQLALHALMDEIRGLADGYQPEDEDLVRALRIALAKVVDQIIIHPLQKPDDAPKRPDNERSVHIFGRHHRIEIVASEACPQTVHMADGSVVEVDLPHFEPVALERADNAAFASIIWSVPSGLVA
jgi:hypothetical protein